MKKKEEELEGFKTFVFKLQKELEKANDSIDEYKNKINILQKENSSMKKQLERLSESIPKELNALQVQLGEANKRNKLGLSNTQSKSMTDREKKKLNNKNLSEITPENYNNLLSKYNDASKEISELKNKNKELQFQLEEKEVKSAYSGFRTEDVNISNYEEEFDLRKMANGAKDKNRSEDINIDYPGIQGIKDKLKEMEFKYKNLVDQVKILIGNIAFNQKIKPQVTQICQLLGYSPKTTGRILTSTKDKKKILGI
jgi:chromosome segregation ATPase